MGNLTWALDDPNLSSPDLVTWLRAVLDHEERLVRTPVMLDDQPNRRALADIAAKWAILDHCDRLRKHAARAFATEADILAAQAVNWAVGALSLAYRDRPGWREEWRPA